MVKIDKRKRKNIKNINVKRKRRLHKLSNRLTRLNNQSRQGMYIGIKDIETKKERLYKWKPEYGIKYYENLFSESSQKKRKKFSTRREINQKTKYLNKIKASGRIDEWIQKGISTAGMVDLRKLDRANIKQMYKELINPLILDKYKNNNLILDSLTSEENIKKYKERIEINVEIFGENGKYLKLTTIGRTIEEIADLLRINFSHEELMRDDIQEFLDLGFRIETSDGVDLKVYDKPWMNKIQSSRLNLVFRKGV